MSNARASGSVRVTLISHTYIEGYAGKLRELAGLCDLRLVLPSGYPAHNGPLASGLLEPRGFEVVSYPARFPFWRKSSTRWILMSGDLGFQTAPADVVHVENERHSFVVIQALRAQRRYAPKARFVVFVWDNHRGGMLRERVTVPVGRFMARYVDMFLAGSRGAADLLEGEGVPRERIVVVPQTGVDRSRFVPCTAEERRAARSRLGLAPDAFVVGFAGRLVVEKGLADLAEAVRALTRDPVLGPRVRLVVAGAGPLAGDVRRWSENGLPVTLLPRVPQSEMGRYLQAMDVIVLPSRTVRWWREQFGRVLVEAMACGVPVIGSDSGAIPEVIGDAGLVTPERDPRALAAALRRLATDPDERRSLVERGLRRARDQYSEASVARQTAAAYDLALSLPKRRPT